MCTGACSDSHNKKTGQGTACCMYTYIPGIILVQGKRGREAIMGRAFMLGKQGKSGQTSVTPGTWYTYIYTLANIHTQSYLHLFVGFFSHLIIYKALLVAESGRLRRPPQDGSSLLPLFCFFFALFFLLFSCILLFFRFFRSFWISSPLHRFSRFFRF